MHHQLFVNNHLSVTVWFRKFEYFLKKDITLQKTAWCWVPRDPSTIFLPLLLEIARKLKFHVFLIFYARKHMVSSFYLKWTKFTRNCEFFPFVAPWGPKLNWNKFTISYEFSPLLVKWWYHMFSSNVMEEYMESEVSGIFLSKTGRQKYTVWVLGDPFYAYEG